MLKLTLALCLITAALIGLTALRLGTPSLAPTNDLVITQRLRAAADLVTLEIEGTQLVESQVAGYLGGTRCLLVARTTTTLATDLTRADVDVDASRVIVTLDPPRVLDVTIDLDRTAAWPTRRTSLWRLLPGEAAETQAHQDALRLAETRARAAVTEDDLAAARHHAESVIATLIDTPDREVSIGWR